MPRPNQQHRIGNGVDQEEHPAPLELGRRMEIDGIFDARWLWRIQWALRR
jgi:hypothetical protein